MLVERSFKGGGSGGRADRDVAPAGALFRGWGGEMLVIHTAPGRPATPWPGGVLLAVALEVSVRAPPAPPQAAPRFIP